MSPFLGICVRVRTPYLGLRLCVRRDSVVSSVLKNTPRVGYFQRGRKHGWLLTALYVLYCWVWLCGQLLRPRYGGMETDNTKASIHGPGDIYSLNSGYTCPGVTRSVVTYPGIMSLVVTYPVITSLEAGCILYSN